MVAQKGIVKRELCFGKTNYFISKGVYLFNYQNFIRILNFMNIKKISLKIEQSKFRRKKITCSKDSSEYMRQFFDSDIEIYESVFILLLDQSNTTIGYSKISQGGIVGSVVDIKIICKYVIDSLAQNLIICHNHPSGNVQPSNTDKQITVKLNEALKLLDSKLLDHIILAKKSYYSFADNCLL